MYVLNPGRGSDKGLAAAGGGAGVTGGGAIAIGGKLSDDEADTALGLDTRAQLLGSDSNLNLFASLGNFLELTVIGIS